MLDNQRTITCYTVKYSPKRTVRFAFSLVRLVCDHALRIVSLNLLGICPI